MNKINPRKQARIVATDQDRRALWCEVKGRYTVLEIACRDGEWRESFRLPGGRLAAVRRLARMAKDGWKPASPFWRLAE